MISTLSRMIRTGILTEKIKPASEPDAAAGNVQEKIWRILGRALCIRHVDAGSCNGCELEIQALNNPYYNLEGMGIKFVASPRHASWSSLLATAAHAAASLGRATRAAERFLT